MWLQLTILVVGIPLGDLIHNYCVNWINPRLTPPSHCYHHHHHHHHHHHRYHRHHQHHHRRHRYRRLRHRHRHLHRRRHLHRHHLHHPLIPHLDSPPLPPPLPPPPTLPAQTLTPNSINIRQTITYKTSETYISSKIFPFLPVSQAKITYNKIVLSVACIYLLRGYERRCDMDNRVTLQHVCCVYTAITDRVLLMRT